MQNQVINFVNMLLLRSMDSVKELLNQCHCCWRIIMKLDIELIATSSPAVWLVNPGYIQDSHWTSVNYKCPEVNLDRNLIVMCVRQSQGISGQWSWYGICHHYRPLVPLSFPELSQLSGSSALSLRCRERNQFSHGPLRLMAFMAWMLSRQNTMGITASGRRPDKHFPQNDFLLEKLFDKQQFILFFCFLD